jgi:lipoyl-dependent peroxiredoxin
VTQQLVREERLIYRAETHLVGGREGHVRSSDGVLDLDLTSPKSEPRTGTNPEQLFAAGYSACFLSAVVYYAESDGFHPVDSTVHAAVDLVSQGPNNFKLRAELRIDLPDVPTDKAIEFVRKAHETCPYSKATRGNIDVSLHANDVVVM